MGLRWYGRLKEGLLSAEKLEPSLKWGGAVYTSKYLQSYCPHTHTYSTSGQFSHPEAWTLFPRPSSVLRKHCNDWSISMDFCMAYRSVSQALQWDGRGQARAAHLARAEPS